MPNISLVVLSLACFESVNRTVYRLLQSEYGIPVHLIIPSSLDFPGGIKEPVENPDETLSITRLPISSMHPRLQIFRGAGAVVSKLKPTHILVDADPASLMSVVAARWARQLDAKLWAVTCENLPRNFVKEALGGLRSASPRAFISGLLNQLFLMACRTRVDQVFTISQDGTRVMEALGFRNRITQMPLGFDAAIFNRQAPQRIEETRVRLGIDRPVVAYFGRVSPEKGVDLLVRSLANLLDRPWQFLLDDFDRYPSPYQVEIQKLLESTGVKDRTVFFQSNHRDIADYMNAADIVVLPSISTPKWKEQYGRVIPEAMACGKVVVGSVSGTLPELIGDRGFVFTEGDIDQLGALLSKLLAMPHDALSEIGAKAYDRAQTQLSANRQAEILHRCLAGAG